MRQWNKGETVKTDADGKIEIAAVYRNRRTGTFLYDLRLIRPGMPNLRYSLWPQSAVDRLAARTNSVWLSF